MNPQPVVDAAARKALEGLVDIAAPPPVSWAPQTLGWAVVAAILVVALIAWLWRARRRSLANRYRTEALRLLASIEPRALDPQTRAEALPQIAAIIKRVALAAYSRGEVASLSGPAWVAFVGTRGLRTDGIVNTLLDDAEYRSSDTLAAIPDADVLTFVTATRAWIKDHRVSA
jgi:hypothetical protein